MNEKQIPIWFFIGALLAVYGLLIFGAGVYAWAYPPTPDRVVKLWKFHAAVWWGALLVIVGMGYVLKFRPSKSETLTGEPLRPDSNA